MPFSFPTMNHHTQLDHHLSCSLQYLNRLAVGDLSEAQTLTLSGSLNNLTEPIKLPQETAAASHQFDDLSAIVQKCNVTGFEKAFLSMDMPDLFIPAAGTHPSGLLPHSQDFTHEDNKPELHSLTKGWTINRGDEQEESLKRKRYVSSRLPPRSSYREDHILSERLRRSEMNELLGQMRSLLPNPSAKSDKASVVSDTIKYIQSLQRGLAIHTKKHATTILRNQLTDGTGLPLKPEAMSLVPKSHNTLCAKCDKSMCIKCWDENVTVNYNGKDIFITINCVNKPNLLPSIILAVESHDMEVMDAFVSVTDRVSFICLHVKAAQILDTVAKEALSATLTKVINSEFPIS